VRQDEQAKRRPRRKSAAKTVPGEAKAPEPKSDGDKKQEAIELALETLEALVRERGAEDKVWGSMIKQAMKRRSPGFNEAYYGFGSFNELLEEGQSRGLLAIDRDEKSGGYTVRAAR
jgi:hypothetical protein